MTTVDSQNPSASSFTTPHPLNFKGRAKGVKERHTRGLKTFPLPTIYRRAIPKGATFFNLKETIEELKLHTVCEEAKCPNRTECWARGSLALQILGNLCTRRCGFCAEETAKPLPPDPSEPQRICEAVRKLSLSHVVITAPARDDLADGGADQFAVTVRLLKREFQNLIVEILISDLQGKKESLQTVLKSLPDIFNHNIETVERLTNKVRSKATYLRSLEVLRFASAFSSSLTEEDSPPHQNHWCVGVKIKSGLMVGLGESWPEIIQTLIDLKNAGVEYLTIGQYLQPSFQHLPVEKFYAEEEFAELQKIAENIGFEKVFAGPLVRSSYFADQLHNKNHAQPNLPLRQFSLRYFASQNPFVREASPHVRVPSCPADAGRRGS